MRCRWLYLVVLLLVLDQLARSAGQRRQRRSNGNQVQSRIVNNNNSPGRVRGNTGSGLNRPQSRIVSGNSRRRNRRLRRNNRRSRRSQRRNNRRGSTNGVSSRIVNNNSQARISRGSTTSISTIPYLVQVHRGSSSFCGGSLISSLWVLTAGHCCSGYSASNYYIVAGTSRLNGANGIRRTVSYMAIAPRYTSRVMNMDACLLRLSSALNGTNIGTIALAQSRPPVGTTLRVAGWGATREGGDSSTLLRDTRVPVVAQNVCRRRYRGQSRITRYMFCAGTDSRDTCEGDSGGPAVLNNLLYGITSFGVGCARAGYPGVYTVVSRIRTWINSTMTNNP